MVLEVVAGGSDRVNWERELSRKARNPEYLPKGKAWGSLIKFLYRAYDLGYEDGQSRVMFGGGKYDFGEDL